MARIGAWLGVLCSLWSWIFVSIMWGDSVFLTAFEPERSLIAKLAGSRGRLLTLCLDRRTGKIAWQREAPTNDVGSVSGVNQPASPTPATDGNIVVSYFGSFGLLAYRLDGTEAWRLEIGPNPHHMGVGSSPIIEGDRVLLNVEMDGPSHLYAIDKKTGRVLWRVPRRTRQAAYATPVVWTGTIVVAGHQSMSAYRMEDGREMWSATGLSDYVVATPVIAADVLVHPQMAVNSSGQAS